MKLAEHIVLVVLLLFMVPWVVIFGSTGALLERYRGGSPFLGACWGVLLGPLGWIFILVTTREQRPYRRFRGFSSESYVSRERESDRGPTAGSLGHDI